MASEKELFITKQYVPVGEPISQNDHTIIYRVKCMAERGTPDGILKMYRKKNISNLYNRLAELDYSEWPHIYSVRYYDENTLVVEEYLEGYTLAELLQKNRTRSVTFTEAEAYNIMDKICSALESLMMIQPPISHHDLKPSNIFITTTGAVKFLDFIPAYKKPKNSFQHMIHFLGSLFHEMLTGKEPPKGKCTYQGRYEAVIRRCFEKSPDKQYTSISSLQEDLDYAKTQEPEKVSNGIAEIPYALTIPFQGTILAFEWILLSFFFVRNMPSVMCLFVVAFCIHSVAFTYSRHRFMKENNVHLSTARKAIPVLILAAILGCLSAAISFFIQ
ncbi:MAG: protein kinase [Lachnospiraceae bacterium]|nr:protein kinase [Lachnospiraceae bacterium]